MPQALGHDRRSQRQHRGTVDPDHAALVRHSLVSAHPSPLHNAAGRLSVLDSMFEDRGVVQNGQFMDCSESGQNRANQGTPRFAFNPDLNHADGTFA